MRVLDMENVTQVSGGDGFASNLITSTGVGGALGSVGGAIATNAARGAATGGAAGAAVGGAFGLGYAAGTLINDHVVDPLVNR